MPIVLITGGNKGLGYDTARKLIKMGYKVYIGCRDGEKGRKTCIKYSIQMSLEL